MEHEAPAFFVWLEQSGFAQAIRQSLWLYPSANVGHIVSLVVFAGAIATMDVRLLGGFAANAPARVLVPARRFAIAAFAGMAVTGSILFLAEASHLATNRVFQLKVALIAAGLINLAIYEWSVKRMVMDLPPEATMPARARTAGMISIALWIAVAACGRSIAYF